MIVIFWKEDVPGNPRWSGICFSCNGEGLSLSLISGINSVSLPRWSCIIHNYFPGMKLVLGV